jgi:peptide/nickel transport system substrate-binding protein
MIICHMLFFKQKRRFAMLKKGIIFVLAAMFIVAFVSSVPAAELRIGLSASVSSMDPIFYVVGPNSAMARNIFDGLINQDESQQLQPALAISWKAIDDSTWEFKLREGVKFHDGSDFTAEDVAATIRRVPLASQNSPSSFSRYVREVKEIIIIDPYTIRIKTDGPAPLLPNNLSRISIQPSEFEKTATKEFNSGRGVIGTGPFKFVSWQQDDHIILARNDAYWGGKPEWEKVTFKFITNNSARVAALLAGDVDMIEKVSTTEINTVKKNKKVDVVSVSSNRVMYLHMDHDREISPHAKGPDGKNPLRDIRVRRALSKAINREALVERIMDGQGIPAGQLVPEGYFGYCPDLKVEKYDPQGAKKLLAEAGYPNGFSMTSHASNNRYPNDAKVAQAIGQMLSKIGIKIEVVTLPKNVYFPRASKREFSFIMGGAAVETGEASGVLGPLLATYGKNQGRGNRGRYSSPAFEKNYSAALKTVDDPKRRHLLQEAMRIGMRDVGVIPLFFLVHNWGIKSDLVYKVRSDGYTLANGVTRK